VHLGGCLEGYVEYTSGGKATCCKEQFGKEREPHQSVTEGCATKAMEINSCA